MLIVNPKAYTYEVLRQDMQELLCAYPFLKGFSLGKSVAGRELFAVSWGEGEKRLFINGAHHGMEWITSLLLMTVTETCARHYAEGTSIGSTDFAALYGRVTAVFCPMVNPDGVQLAICGLEDTLPPLTKTRLTSYNGGSSDFSRWQANLHGVDLNHNYDAGFSKGVFMQHKLGIYSPGPTRYSGCEPECEPESKAVADFTRDFMPDLAVAYHTQGEIIYYDFESKATERGRRMAETLSEISGYALDKTEGMASYSGYKDWVINELYIPAFTIEAGLGENPLPLEQFDKIYRDNLPMLLYLMSL